MQFRQAIFLAAMLLGGTASAQNQNMVFSPDADAFVRNDSPHAFADIFLEGDRFTGAYSIQPAVADVGRAGDLFLVANVDGKWFQHNGSKFVPWTQGGIRTLQPFASKTLEALEQIPVLDNTPLLAGSYTVYAGYRTAGGPLQYNKRPLRFEVASSTGEQLVRFRSAEDMAAYIKSGLQNGGSVLEKTLITSLEAADTAGGRTSTTNLQTAGVDEADIIKVSGSDLFMLKGCESGPCIEVHGLDSAGAASVLLGSRRLQSENAPDEMYLVDGAGGRTLVTLSGKNWFWAWFTIWGWSDGQTTLEFLDAAAPDAMETVELLTLDGSLVSSRRVGDTLYVVTRYTPAIEGFEPYPADDKQQQANAEVLQAATLPALLPTVTNAAKQTSPLVDSEDCYMPTSAVDKSSNPSIITITSISLQSRQPVASTCFLGDSETLYMTTDSLYLATTSWSYAMPELDRLSYSPNHTTSVHKFALNAEGFEYRGSAEVDGHLGWAEDKKSFRMGENGEFLNIVTSKGDTWDGSASTSLSVLQDKGSGKLDVVNVIDGIGKPGEELYAARFLGDRAYLVTFRVTDPLYVVDLSDNVNPRLVGELEIDGYSDYLHPISENLLLGIGKDAIPDTSNETGDARGAWYQGLKLALFDVSNPANPVEIDSEVLGKRGTESEVLYDHHAFTWLPPLGEEPARIAIPVSLHDDVPEWEGFDSEDPSSWYDFTHKALYSFEVSANGVTPTGRIIAEDAEDISYLSRLVVDFAPYVRIYPDRSVLMDDAVYYIHDGKVLSSFWGENADLSE